MAAPTECDHEHAADDGGGDSGKQGAELAQTSQQQHHYPTHLYHAHTPHLECFNKTEAVIVPMQSMVP